MLEIIKNWYMTSGFSGFIVYLVILAAVIGGHLLYWKVTGKGPRPTIKGGFK